MQDREGVKSIPGSRWNSEVKKWHTPLSWSACRQLRAVFGDRLEIGPELWKWAKSELDLRVAPSLALRNELSIQDPGGLPHGLYNFQEVGALFLITAKQALCADEMGSGKTIQVIAAAKAVNELPMLVIAPNSCKRSWAREVEKWWPGIPVYVVDGTAPKRQKILAEAGDNPGVVIINYESVRLHSRLAPYGSIALTDAEKTPKELNFIPWKIVISDESHKLSSPRTKWTRAVWAVGHGPSVRFRWALTGTPLTNAPDTLFPILHFLNPQEWPSKTQFISRYCLTGFNPFGGLDVFGIRPEMQTEFEDIFHPRFRRCVKEAILPQLPPIIYERRDVQMNPKQAKAYNTMAESLWATTDDGSMVIASSALAQLTRMVQFASSYAELTEDGVRLSDPSCKLDALMEDLADFNEPVVVFAQSRQLIEMAANRLEKADISYSIIKGGQTTDVRQNQIDSFQEAKVDVCLVVISAGGVGVTLNRARIGIFLQRSFSNVDQQQAIGRIHRIGSEHHESVVVIDYVTENSIESAQLEILAGKAEMLEEVVKDKVALKRLLYAR